MSIRLAPYPDYKDSGLPWLGKIPRHWQLLKTKYLFRESSEKGYPDEPLLAATQAKGVVRKELYESRTVLALKDLHLLKLVRVGNFVISLRSFQGGIECAHHRGIISPAYTILCPTDRVNTKFFARLLKSKPYIDNLSIFVTGIRQGQNIDYARLSRSFLPVPSSEEQDAIGSFVSYVGHRINRLVRAKRRLIELLNEQKQAIIHRAVTRGFVEKLPVNILRLPQAVNAVPGWRSFCVGHLIQRRWLKIQDGNHGELHPKAADYVDHGIPFLMANNIRPEGLDLFNCAKITEKQARGLRIGFAVPGDVLLTHKATIGQVGIVRHDLKWPFVMLTPQVTYYRCVTSDIDPQYLFLYMQSPQFQEQLRVLSLNQSTRSYIGIVEQRNLVINFPSLEKQKRLRHECEQACAPVDYALARATREIDLLREYRTRLIADVVTGKLDVRGVELPELSETEPLNYIVGDAETEAMNDTEEPFEQKIIE